MFFVAIKMLDLRRNLEVKIRWPECDATRQVLGRLEARCEGVQRQSDIFFHATAGRLKLRRIEGRPAVLIWYDRPNHSGARTSAFYLTPVADADLLEATLTAAVGVRGRVDKSREVWLWRNVRIHLDDVAGLGSFLELESVIAQDVDEAQARTNLEQLIAELGLPVGEALPGAYADLLGL